jgi:hypothetical protein
MSRARTAHARPLESLVLSAGFLALGVAVVAAYTTPATSYEVSVYAGTPTVFWVGFWTAMVVSVAVAVAVDSPFWRRLALVLGGTAAFVFAALPIVRGYHFYAAADSMTHLGWVRDFASGTLEPLGLFYPGLHTITVLVHELTGFELPRSLMITVAAFTLVFLLFATLTVRSLTDSGLGTAAGAVSAFMLLPINVVITKLSAHPISQTVLYSSLVLFLFVRYLSGPIERTGWRSTATEMGLLLTLSLVTLVLYHPLGALVVLILFGTISLTQFLQQRRTPDVQLVEPRALYGPTVVLAVWFVLWAGVAQPVLLAQAESIVGHIAAFLGGGGGAGEIVTNRQSSLQQVGGSLLETYLKLFLVSTVYAVVAGLVMASSLLDWFDGRYRSAGEAIRLVTLGLLVLFPWMVIQFVGNISSLFFRYVGFVMVITTIVGAFGIYYAARHRRLPVPRMGPVTVVGQRTARVGLFVVLVTMLALSVAFTFPSPSLYQPSGHVTEAQFDGYRTAFDHTDAEYDIASVGMGVSRYEHAVEGTTGVPFGTGTVPVPDYDHDLVGFISDESRGDGRYLVVSERARVTRVQVYRGFRYDTSDFRAVEQGRNVDRVFANGEVDIYLHTDTDGESA